MKGDLDEIQHRIWRGQVTVLFAFVEEMRRRILPRVRSYLRLPVETTYGIVSDADDLEVGQLLYFLRGMRLPNKLWGQLKLLTDIRHSLAHLQPVSHETLCSEDLFSNMES